MYNRRRYRVNKSPPHTCGCIPIRGIFSNTQNRGVYLIEYPKYAPKQYECLYCKHSPLEIWAFVYFVLDNKGRKRERATPVLVCNKGCGTFFDPMEFDLTPKDLEVTK